MLLPSFVLIGRKPLRAMGGITNGSAGAQRYNVEATILPGAVFKTIYIEDERYYWIKYTNGNFYMFCNKEQLEQYFERIVVNPNNIWNSLNG